MLVSCCARVAAFPPGTRRSSCAAALLRWGSGLWCGDLRLPRTRRTRQGRPVRTYSPKPGEIERQWHVIDAADVVLGRLATHVATLLRGKHKPTFAPHIDTGDFVVVVNAG